MTTTAAYPAPMRTNVLRRAEAWLDAKGRAAWIAALVLGFIVFWPIGLALLAYMIWGKKMFGHSCRQHLGTRHDDSHRSAWAAEWGRADRTAFRASGNAAFDSYKADTLRRLEEEQEAFEGFLQRLRQAKDKSEFDSFMEDRARRTREDAASAGEDPKAADPQDPARRGEY